MTNVLTWSARRAAVPLALALGVALAVGPVGGPTPALAVSLEVDHTLVLDGVDDRATAGTEVIPTDGSGFTVEAWVYDADADAAGWQHILSQGKVGTAFYLGTTKDSQQIRAGDTWSATGVDLPAGRWVHIALTTPGSGTAKLYLDGRLEAELGSGFTGPTVIGEDFQLGTQYTTAEFWHGRIDTVRVWSVERSANEIAGAMHAALPASTSGLIAQYLANEGSGTAVRNTVAAPGGPTDLTLAGGAGWASVATTVDDGDDRVITFPRSVHTLVGGWVVPDDVTTADLLVVGGGGGGGAWVGGGGGAGGMTEVSGASLTTGAVVPVTVGVGGRGAANAVSGDGFVAGTDGQDSSFGLTASATGGGVGASWTSQAAGDGGSGGGGSKPAGDTYDGADGLAGQGSGGGDAFVDAQPHPAGGGGGAGGPGQSGQSATVSGTGGPGRSSSITGAAVLYAGGGGGSSHGLWVSVPDSDPNTLDAAGTPGAGGTGGGGAGAGPVATTGTVRGGDGTAGLGGGGGGAGNNCLAPCRTSIGGDGGSGVIVIRLIGVLASGPAPAVTIAPATTCTPVPPLVGDVVTCSVTGGDPGIDILWEVAFNPVVAEGAVTLDARGGGTFAFTVPAVAFGRELTVELVAWTAPQSLGVVGGPAPAMVPAGQGPRSPLAAILGPLALVAVLGPAMTWRVRSR